MLHSVVCRLLRNTCAIRIYLGTDRLKALLLRLVRRLQLFNACELVGHFIFHAIDVLSIDLHFLVHTTLQIGYLFEVHLAGLNFNLQGGCGRLSLVKLALLKVEIFAHLFDTIGGGKFVLARQVLLHVLKQGSDGFLRVSHIRLELLLFGFVLFCEVIYLFFLFVKDLVLLIVVVATVFRFVTKVAFNFFNVTGICINHFTKVRDLLLLLLDLSVVLLYTVHEALPCLRER